MENNMNLFELIILICQKTAKLFRKIGNNLLRLFRFSVQNALILLICIVVFGVAGYFMTDWSRAKFRGTTTIFYNEAVNLLVRNHLERLDSYCHARRFKVEPAIPDSLRKRVKAINYYNWIDSKNDGTADFVDFEGNKSFHNDTANVIMNDRLLIEVETNGLYELDAVQQWIQNYFDQQTELTDMAEQGRQTVRTECDALNREIVRLDSLSNYEYFSDKDKIISKNGILMSQSKTLYYDDILELISKKNALETSISRTPRNINFQNSLIVCKASSRMLAFALWLIAGYAIGLVIAAVKRYRKEICTYLKG